MTREAFDRALDDRFGTRVRRHAPLAPLTTFKVGGAADWLLDIQAADDVQAALGLASEYAIAVAVLGGGSNVLVPDDGIRGLVIRLHGGSVSQLAADRIRAGGGVTINGLVRWTVSHGLAGLEAWAGTPGTVGGAVHGNAHFRGRLISELIASVTLISRGGELRHVPVAEMELGYDTSRLHRTGEIVVAADFIVFAGAPEPLRAIARDSLAFRKRTQPLASPSAGCIFQNPDPSRDAVPAGIPPSAGALVDRAGLKNATDGGARVSPTHGNFIVNDGGATAASVKALIDRCKTTVRERFGVELREEIVYLEAAASARGEGHE
ncbi:MAG: UDP-N-acetylmuramate dehydrogenase [Vicinamibacterales bacterium]